MLQPQKHLTIPYIEASAIVGDKLQQCKTPQSVGCYVTIWGSDHPDSLINATEQWFLFCLHFKLDVKSAKCSDQAMHRAIDSSSPPAPSHTQPCSWSITDGGTMLPVWRSPSALL